MFFKNNNQDTLYKLKLLSSKVKKNNSLIVSGNTTFTGNSKYFFLEFVNKNKEIDCHYLTYHNDVYEMLKYKNLPVIHWTDKPKLNDLLKLLHCKYYFSDFDLNPSENINNPYHYSLVYGAKKISTYHGITMKRYPTKNNINFEKDQNFLNDFIAKKEVDVFISPSKNSDKIWYDHFYSPKKIIYMNHPFINVFKDTHDENELINVDEEVYKILKERYKKKLINIIYCPTFRVNNIKNNDWIKKINFQKINSILKDNNLLLVLHFHPGDPNINIIKQRKSYFSNILLTKKGSDIYPALYHTNLMISDYSSISTDYSLLNKPIVFFRPDHKKNFVDFENWDWNFYNDFFYNIGSLDNFFINFKSEYSKLSKIDYLQKIQLFSKKIFKYNQDVPDQFSILKIYEGLNNETI